MSASESLSRTLRLQLVDARDKAQRALREYEEADDPTERVQNELVAATKVLELELSSHVDVEYIYDDPSQILNREWSSERYAERVEELLRLFDDLGFGRLVRREVADVEDPVKDSIPKPRKRSDSDTEGSDD